MKMRSYLLGLSAVALAAVSCSKEVGTDLPTPVVPDEGETVVNVAIHQKTSTRALAIGNASAIESAINDYTIYVFDSDTKILLNHANGNTTNPYVTRISIPAGTTNIQVAAVVNPGSVAVPAMEVGTATSDDLDGMVVELASQSPDSVAKYGMLMVGQSAVTAVADLPDQANNVDVSVARVAAKVELGTVTISPAALTLTEILQFSITGVGIQRAQSSVLLDGWGTASTSIPWATDTNSDWVGGFTTFSNGSTPATTSEAYTKNTTMLADHFNNTLLDRLGVTTGVQTLLETAVAPPLGLLYLVAGTVNLDGLIDAINGIGGLAVSTLLSPVTSLINSLEDIVFDDYFYVLPNDATMSTLLTLETSLGTKTYYYPIVINGPGSEKVDGNPTVGTSIVESNTVYRIDLTIETIIGSDDPDDSELPLAVTATIKPVEWGHVSQDVTW